MTTPSLESSNLLVDACSPGASHLGIPTSPSDQNTILFAAEAEGDATNIELRESCSREIFRKMIPHQSVSWSKRKGRETLSQVLGKARQVTAPRGKAPLTATRSRGSRAAESANEKSCLWIIQTDRNCKLVVSLCLQ